MNRQARLSAGSFEAGLVVEVVGGRALFRSWTLREKCVVIEQRLDDLEVVGDVGPHVEQAVGLQDASNSVGKQVGEESAAAMFSFPPRVGKVNVDRSQ